MILLLYYYNNSIIIIILLIIYWYYTHTINIPSTSKTRRAWSSTGLVFLKCLLIRYIEHLLCSYFLCINLFWCDKIFYLNSWVYIFAIIQLFNFVDAINFPHIFRRPGRFLIFDNLLFINYTYTYTIKIILCADQYLKKYLLFVFILL